MMNSRKTFGLNMEPSYNPCFGCTSMTCTRCPCVGDRGNGYSGRHYHKMQDVHVGGRAVSLIERGNYA